VEALTAPIAGEEFCNNHKYLLSRLWIQNKELRDEDSFPCRVPWNEEHEFSKDPREVSLGFQKALP